MGWGLLLRGLPLRDFAGGEGAHVLWMCEGEEIVCVGGELREELFWRDGVGYY